MEPVWKSIWAEAEYTADIHSDMNKYLNCDTYQRIQIWQQGAHTNVDEFFLQRMIEIFNLLMPFPI